MEDRDGSGHPVISEQLSDIENIPKHRRNKDGFSSVTLLHTYEPIVRLRRLYLLSSSMDDCLRDHEIDLKELSYRENITMMRSNLTPFYLSRKLDKLDTKQTAVGYVCVDATLIH